MGQGPWNEWLWQMQQANNMVNNQAPWLGGQMPGGVPPMGQPGGAPPAPSEPLQQPEYWAGYNPDRMTQDYDPRDENFRSLPPERQALVRQHSQYNAWQRAQQGRMPSGAPQGQPGTQWTPQQQMERQRFMQSMDLRSVAAQGMTPEQVMQDYDRAMAQRGGMSAMSAQPVTDPATGQVTYPVFDNGYRPDGSNYSPPMFTQPSYDQATMPALDDAQFERLLAWNNAMGIPWSEFIRNTYQNDRDFGRDVYQDARDYGTDVFRDNRNFGEDTRRYDQGFGEDQFRDRRDFGEDTRRFENTFGEDRRRWDTNFGESQFIDRRNFGEDVRRNDRDFGEDTRRWDTNFGENQRQYDTTFGENRRQFNETLDWRKIDDAMRTFGSRQMPNVRQVSFR